MLLEHYLGPNWRKQTTIKLSAGLDTFPLELLEIADTLQVLDLSGNAISSLPNSFASFQQLHILFLSDNQFSEFPEVLGECKNLDIIGFKANQIHSIPEQSLPLNLRWLILTDNQISQLPESIGNCHRLQKLMLAGNQLSALPHSILQCTRLELIRISANNFSIFPSELFSLPSLSWLAVAGNPFSVNLVTEEILPSVPFEFLEIRDLLGEGASGHIYAAHDKRSPELPLAVKFYKKNITSDGYPADEMKASIKAGQHEGLVRLRGLLASHPDEKEGLLMALIPNNFRILGLPPTFETCTRDNYPEGTSFSIEKCLQILRSIACVMAHLHQKGIIHGDLYPHNILSDEQGNSLITDFGAASIPNLPKQASERFQRLEIRAFGCLMDDLLTRCIYEESQKSIFDKLCLLRDLCMSENIEKRPLAERLVMEIEGYSVMSNDTKHEDQP